MRKDKQYEEVSKKRLNNNLKKKFDTTTIGSLSAFEDEFGFLWGHGKKYSDLDDEEKYWREKWSKTRTTILDLGNSNLRAAQSEISQYTISWNRYITNFVIKDSEEL